MSSRNTQAVLACVSVCCAVSAQAEGRWSIGLGAGVESEVYQGDDTNLGIGVNLEYETERLTIGFGGLSYKAVSSDTYEFTLRVAPRFDPDFPDSALFAGLDRDTAIEAGFFVRRDFGNDISAEASFLHDVSSTHDGYEAQVQLTKAFFAQSARIDASLGLRYRDGDLNAHLVGVSAAEANSLRGAYSPGSTISPNIQLSATIPVTANSALIGTLAYEHFGGSYSDSPLVENGGVAAAAIALVYQF